MNRDNLNSFLRLGYFLKYDSSGVIDVSNIDKDKYKGVSRADLVSLGADAWRHAIQENFDYGQKHLVPISGGVDSRAILAGLLEFTDAKNIYTYTFGSPGSMDFDIGNYVAKKIGTNHTVYDLNKYQFNQDELLDISVRVEQQTMLFHHAPVWKIDKEFKGCRIWSGFMGDPLAGSHLSKNPAQSIEVAKRNFLHKNIYVKSIHLGDVKDLEGLIDWEFQDNKLLTYEEQLDFQNRQIKYIAPHVLMKGYEYSAPFLAAVWRDFILSVDNKYRIDQCLYYQMLLTAYPDVFSYKTKSNYGLPIGSSKFSVKFKLLNDKVKRKLRIKTIKDVNYLDFCQKIRIKNDIKKIVVGNLHDLDKRKLVDGLDITKLIKDHMSGKADHSDILLVLASLEIHLKTGLKL